MTPLNHFERSRAMSKRRKNRQSLKNIGIIQLSMILGYAFIVIASIAIVSQLAVKKTDEVLKNKVISLTSSLNVQMKLNMESYLSRMETTATLAFGQKEAYTYDAADPDNDEFEALNTEKIITEKLFSLCIMENFVDYGIVYSNNRTVGKISNATSTTFGDRIFPELESMITNERTNDGWFTGYGGDFRRIYYVKRVHENAVLVISFYANELNEVFDNPETLKDMQIRLVNKDYDIIFSKQNSEIGSQLHKGIKDRIIGQSSASVMDNEYLVSVNSCGDDWYVVCSIPTSIILNEKNEVTRYIYMTAFAAAVIAAIIGMYLSHIITKPVKKMVTMLDDKAKIDLLTGILNKLTFEEYAGNCIERSAESEQKALLIIDLDNFKGINDNYGHAMGDKVLEDLGEVMRGVFSDDDYLGRIGGDEFAVLINSTFDSEEKLKEHITRKCTELSESFKRSFDEFDNGMRTTVSIGAALSPADGKSFAELYAACDKALYKSKKTGRDRFSFYDAQMESEVVR